MKKNFLIIECIAITTTISFLLYQHILKPHFFLLLCTTFLFKNAIYFRFNQYKYQTNSIVGGYSTIALFILIALKTNNLLLFLLALIPILPMLIFIQLRSYTLSHRFVFTGSIILIALLLLTITTIPKTFLLSNQLLNILKGLFEGGYLPSIIFSILTLITLIPFSITSPLIKSVITIFTDISILFIFGSIFCDFKSPHIALNLFNIRNRLTFYLATGILASYSIAPAILLAPYLLSFISYIYLSYKSRSLYNENRITLL